MDYSLFFLVSLLGVRYYGIYGLLSFNTYMFLFYQSRNNNAFQKVICSKNYVKGIEKCYELVAYSMSAVNAVIISVFSSIYLLSYYASSSTVGLQYGLQYGLEIVYKFSMGYYVADIMYLLSVAYSDKNKGRIAMISMQDAFFILHHAIVIYYQAFTIDDRNELASTARYYFSYCFLSEYAVLPLNYGWYLINTNQTKNKKFIITGIITIIVYFLSRIVNFTMILYFLWLDGLLSYGLIAIPLIFLNYYWFYKLLVKSIFLPKLTK